VAARSSATGPHHRISSVSGERVFLVDTGNVADLVRAAGTVVEYSGLPVALIGGLAVAVRLATAHRATGDVDLVSESSADLVARAAGTAAENLVKSKVATWDTEGTSVRLHVGSTKVEFIETERIEPGQAAEIEPERSRFFVLGHRWALETATPLTISVVDRELEAQIPVATAAALVAMKLHSILDRSADTKRASDAWDIYRLLEAHNPTGEITRALAGGPEGLAPVAAAALDRVFRSDVTRTRHWIQGFGDPRWAAVMTDNALVSAATELIDGLDRPDGR
jgi:hypothetical protein